jgi:hypothetical protein
MKINKFYKDDPEPISLWFELTYAQYLTIPRSILESMPHQWQAEFATLLAELDDTLDWRPKEGRYWVQLKDGKGRYKHDPFMEYRHAPKWTRELIESQTKEEKI